MKELRIDLTEILIFFGANTHDDDARLHYFKFLNIPGTFNIGNLQPYWIHGCQ